MVVMTSLTVVLLLHKP